jgi:predicted GH43/DUF377 family glycosyl hydrolase
MSLHEPETPHRPKPRVRVRRFEHNPVLTPRDVPPHRPDFEVIGAFNAGVARYGGEILLLLRVAERPRSDRPNVVRTPVWDAAKGELRIDEFDLSGGQYDVSDPRSIREISPNGRWYLTSISYLRVARSRDGRNFTVDDEAFLFPGNALESYGVEDPRITEIDGVYYITYSAVSPFGIAVGLASTRDFVSVQRHGLILPPENKDVVLFPEAIGGHYYALHRPVPKGMGSPEIWIAKSPDLYHWGEHRPLLGLRPGKWDSRRLGGGAVPIRTPHGWLELYHAADDEDRYCMGAVLLDLDDPTRVIARSDEPIFEPEADYEIEGFYGRVVFSCGVLVEEDEVEMYYGAADTSMACAEMSLKEILDSLTPV